MKSTAEIRQMFQDFYHSKGHEVISSSSLIPFNDPTLLFTNAGMNQFKDVFLGIDKRPYKRATTAQRCVRAGGKHNDLDNVGYTARHHTFFEMLGNFSFGDYFKREAIHYAWELLTDKNWFGLPKEKLLVTVYESDDEAYNIWLNEIGIPADKIIRIGDNKGEKFASDNFWQMGDTGPCGPCSEIFYDHGEHLWGGPPGSPDEDGDRFIEIWNLVFMQFNRLPDGTMEPLPKPSVDTGMGLERISAVMQHVNSNYDIDLFKSLIADIAQLLNVKDTNNKSLRVIADHIRSCAFLISDGVTPSNEGRGYVLRRIIRRAIRHGNMLGAKEIFFYKLAKPLAILMESASSELLKNIDFVEQSLKTEEEQFLKTLERGLQLLEQELTKVKNNKLDGEIAFKLYDTYGFPLDLTADVCREKNITVDESGFNQLMEEQRNRSRESDKFAVDYSKVIKLDNETEFLGYQEKQLKAKVVALFSDGISVNKLKPGDQGIVVLDKTPFYSESGGQIGDKGQLKTNQILFEVTDTQKYGKAIGHSGVLKTGELNIGDEIEAIIESEIRERVKCNHSATHLLQAALRQILGTHIQQKGSLVNDAYLRFDFSHPQPISKNELSEIETLVNAKIRANFAVATEIMNIDEAKKKGAMALFGEKYDDQVRVLSMGDFSIELCGGTHVNRTGDIGLFKIISESSVASGVRRIEAITSSTALEYVQKIESNLIQASQLLKTDKESLVEKINALMDEQKRAEKEIAKLKSENLKGNIDNLLKSAQLIKDNHLLVVNLDGVDPKSLRELIDDFKNRLKQAVIVISSINGDKINLAVGVTNNLTQALKAGEIVSNLANALGGKGGGRPDFAQAGGVDIEKLDSVLSQLKTDLSQKLESL